MLLSTSSSGYIYREKNLGLKCMCAYNYQHANAAWVLMFLGHARTPPVTGRAVRQGWNSAG